VKIVFGERMSSVGQYLLRALIEAIRWELTSGDPKMRKLLVELLLNVNIKKSEIQVPVDIQNSLIAYDTSNDWWKIAILNPLSANGNLNVNVNENAAGLATENTLAAIKSQTDKLSFDANNNLLSALNADNVGLAKEATLSAFKDQAYDSAADLYKQSIERDNVGLAKDSTLQNMHTPERHAYKVLEAPDYTVDSGRVLYVASDREAAFNNLTINGKARVDGKLLVFGELVLNGDLVLNNGVLEVGA